MKPNGRTRSVLLLGALSALLLCNSCQGGKKLNPVHGQVLVDGKPAEGAIVTFHPAADGGEATEQATPSGIVSADGSFTLITYDSEKRLTYEGVPAGDYLVSIIWQDQEENKQRTKAARAKTQETETPPKLRRPTPPKNLLPKRYGSPKTSGLRAQVKEGSNELPPFELTRK